MQQLNSSNYDSVSVVLKDETITMPAGNGSKLMEFLTTDNNSSHVMITDIGGNKVVVNKFDIKKVTPLATPPQYKTFDQLAISDTPEPEHGEGYRKFQETKKKFMEK